MDALPCKKLIPVAMILSITTMQPLKNRGTVCINTTSDEHCTIMKLDQFKCHFRNVTIFTARSFGMEGRERESIKDKYCYPKDTCLISARQCLPDMVL